MHEMSLTEALVEHVLKAADGHHLKAIQEVEVEAGALKRVVPSLMQEAFAIVSQGTIADGAKLTIIEIPARAQCNLCQEIFEPEYDNFLCPDCHKADVRILQGDDLILKSIKADS
jgi:hydrogenase nickel incorporation protein HypA/HybF